MGLMSDLVSPSTSPPNSQNVCKERPRIKGVGKLNPYCLLFRKYTEKHTATEADLALGPDVYCTLKNLFFTQKDLGGGIM